MHLNVLARLLRTAGEENRLRILCALMQSRQACVSDIAKELELSVAVVSHHLQVMAGEGLVAPRRAGKRICYELPREAFVADLKRFICRHKGINDKN